MDHASEGTALVDEERECLALNPTGVEVLTPLLVELADRKMMMIMKDVKMRCPASSSSRSRDQKKGTGKGSLSNKNIINIFFVDLCPTKGYLIRLSVKLKSEVIKDKYKG